MPFDIYLVGSKFCGCVAYSCSQMLDVAIVVRGYLLIND